jgi:pyridoxine kinase
MLALILSSFVAGNRIGGGAQQLALAALGIEAHLAPTIVLGRNPAKGATGRAIAPDHFAGMLGDLAAEGLFARADLVITGYFASAEQVRAAAGALGAIRAASPGVRVVVDPIMGDHPKGLYVAAGTAKAVADELVPRADFLAPNAWELSHLTGIIVDGPKSALQAARTLGRPVLATSIAAGPGEIGAVAVDDEAARLLAHPMRARSPNGAGDLVTAVLAAGLGRGLSFQAAAGRAVRAAALAVDAAGEADLPLADLATRLMQEPPGFRIEALNE